MFVAQTILALLSAYLGLGLVFAAAFVTVGVGRFDPAARGVSATLRLLFVPGAAALWPLLLVRWLRASKGEAHS